MFHFHIINVLAFEELHGCVIPFLSTHLCACTLQCPLRFRLVHLQFIEMTIFVLPALHYTWVLKFQADNLRQQTLQQMHRILTTRQSARALLAIHDYFSRLRALSSLWLARPRE